MRRVLAVAALAILPAALAVIVRMRQGSGFTVTELIAYPLVFGSLGIAAVIAVERLYLGRPLAVFNGDDGRPSIDVLHGFVLAGVYFVLFALFRATLAGALRSEPNLELLGLMLEMRERPLLLVIWFGPVLWVGIALFEELVRAFLLIELWSFSPRPAWSAVAILVAALLFGLVHWGQGPYGIVTIALKSVVSGAYYLHRRRLLPLVVAHALYDGVQVAVLLVTYPDAGA